MAEGGSVRADSGNGGSAMAFFFSRLRAAGWLLLAGSWVSLEGRLPSGV